MRGLPCERNNILVLFTCMHACTHMHMKIALLLLLLKCSQCGVPASWDAQHTTVCLDYRRVHAALEARVKSCVIKGGSAMIINIIIIVCT